MDKALDIIRVGGLMIIGILLMLLSAPTKTREQSLTAALLGMAFCALAIYFMFRHI